MDDLKQKYLKQVYEIFDGDAESLPLTANLREDLNTKSSQYIAMMGVIQDLTGKRVKYGEIRRCNTLEDTVALLEKKANS